MSDLMLSLVALRVSRSSSVCGGVTSYPAQNALPAPLKVITLISGSSSALCKQSINSALNCKLKAFNFSGRFKVTLAIPSLGSYLIKS